MEKEPRPDPNETIDTSSEVQETQPASPEENAESMEESLDTAQAEQMTVELQGELGNTANALLERAKDAGLAEDEEVQGLLGEFAQLSEQLNTTLEDFKAEVAKAEAGVATIAAAHETMPNIVGAEQVTQAQAGVEAAQAKVAQAEAANKTLQAEQARVEGVLEDRVNKAPDATKETESSIESVASGLKERFVATKDALSDTHLKKMYEVRSSGLQDIVDGKGDLILNFDMYPTPDVDYYLDANGQDAEQKERDLTYLYNSLRKVVDGVGNINVQVLEKLEQFSPVPGIRDALSELKKSIDSESTAGDRAYEKITEQMSKDERKIFEMADLDKVGELTPAQKEDILAKRIEVFQRIYGMDIDSADAHENPDASDELKDKMRKGEAGWRHALKDGLILGLEKTENEREGIQVLGVDSWKKKRREMVSSVFDKRRKALDQTKGILEASRASAKKSEAFLNDASIVESLKLDTKAQLDKLKESLAQ